MMSGHSRPRPDKSQRAIVFVTFETPTAPSGGLAAVMKELPRQMGQHETCFVLAPYFQNITGPLPVLGTFPLSLRGKLCMVELRQVGDSDHVPTFLLSSEGRFTARSDPYLNDDPDTLVEDALFFCAAVPHALTELARRALAPAKDLVLHLQDWETACVVQSVRKHPDLESVACVLTLHNPYDRYLGSVRSPLATDLIGHLGLQRGTVLAQMMPLMDGPISTVSQNFADELSSEPLHTHVFVPHLQELLASKGVVGIDNGRFGQLQFPFSQRARQHAEQGDYRVIQAEKWGRRVALGEVLQAYEQERSEQLDEGAAAWGDDLDLSDPHIPVFLILGRDDPRQKGFDVLAEAIRTIPPGRGRYVFTPMPGAEGVAGLSFLKTLARQRPGEVKVFPFRLAPAPFRALQQGSSFMVMGSLYEPFGAATEAYLAGMPVVARATGGLIQQVVPHPSASLSRQGRQVVHLFHTLDRAPTGFLFREPAVPHEVEGWQKIVDCDYARAEPMADRIDDRRGIPLFDAMVQRAAWALQDAIDLYQSDQTAYATMIHHGFTLLDSFQWDRAVREYRRLYDRVCR
jgi:glycogen synthase